MYDGLVKPVKVGKPVGHAADDVDPDFPRERGVENVVVFGRGFVEPLIEVSLLDELVDEEAFGTGGPVAKDLDDVVVAELA